jgi:hypothetical protein
VIFPISSCAAGIAVQLDVGQVKSLESRKDARHAKAAIAIPGSVLLTPGTFAGDGGVASSVG